MLRRSRFLVLGAVLCGIVGLWFGVNLGKGNVFYANPFKERSVAERIKEDVKQGVRDTQRSLHDALKE